MASMIEQAMIAFERKQKRGRIKERVPAGTVRVGDRIYSGDENNKGREVKSVMFYSDNGEKRLGACRPECVHIDHECYDMRFSEVMVSRK